MNSLPESPNSFPNPTATVNYVSDDALMPLAASPTMENLVRYVDALDPKQASGQVNGAMEKHCATPEITSFTDKSGNIVTLSRVGGKIAVAYVRVSTHLQMQDGRSIETQVRRIVEYFVSKGWAFRLVSDASISGGTPPNDQAIIAKVRWLKHDRFEKVFERAFLSEYITTYNEAEKAQLRKYLKDCLEKIVAGIEDPENEPEPETQPKPPPKPKWRGNEAKSDIRPGLTVVRNWYKNTHTIAITDRTRLSRSAALAVKLSEEMSKRNISLVGVVEPLGKGDDDSAELVQLILGYVAEATLTQVCGNSIRGIETMLQNGLPHGNLPFWCVRVKGDNNKTVRVEENPLGMATMRALVRMALEGDENGKEMGPGRILEALQAGVERGEYITPSEYDAETKAGGVWNLQTVKRYISDPKTLLLLRGMQNIFGLERRVLPVVINDYQYGKLLERKARRTEELGGRPPANLDRWYLGKGLFRCWCGNRLQANSNRNQYSCPDSLVPALRKGRKHLILNMPDVHRFLEDLLRCSPLDLIETVTGMDESQTLHTQYIEARDAHDALIAEREESRITAEIDARVYLDRRYAPDNPKYAVTLANMVDADLVGIDEQIATAKHVMDERNQADENYSPPVGYTDYAEQLTRLDEMTDEEKNRLLTRLFRPFQCHGDAPHQGFGVERLSADSRRLPPIAFRCKDMGAGKWERRLPSAAEWYADVQRHLTAPITHTRNSTTGVMTPWAEVRNFTLDTNPRPETATDAASGEPVTDLSATVAPWPDDEK